ncbi:hypothetical protein [Halocola ammonii]
MGLRICLFFSLIVFSVVSCSDSASPSLKSENGFYQVEITELAGSKIWKNLDGEEDTIENFLPVPVNLGEFAVAPIDSINDREFIKCFVLNSGSSVGEVMEVYPVAVLKLLDGEKSVPFMLLVPKEKERRLLDIRSLFELQKECYTCKKNLEEWLSGLPAHRDLVFFGWEDETQAERLLDQYSQISQSAEN